MESNTIQFIPHSQYMERANSFYEVYELIDVIVNDDPRYSKRNMKPARKRTCRFCGKSHPETQFSNYSHLLPQLVGNRNLYSDFECDPCNELFSGVENDLAEFLGVSRSIVGLAEAKKAPGFKAKTLFTKSRSFIGHNLLIIAPDDVEVSDNRTTIRYMKNSFVPANVYKALLKCALSLLDEKTVESKYDRAMDCLMGAKIITRGAFLTGYKYSFSLNLPLHVCHFRKRKQEKNVHTDVFIFNFQNTMISIPVPFHRDDFTNSTQDFTCPIPPPYFTNEQNMSIAMPVSFVRDMASGQKIEDEEERITLLLDPDQLKQTVVYNPLTGKIEKKEKGPDSVKYLVVTREGASFDPKELSEFIESQTGKK